MFHFIKVTILVLKFLKVLDAKTVAKKFSIIYNQV